MEPLRPEYQGEEGKSRAIDEGLFLWDWHQYAPELSYAQLQKIIDMTAQRFPNIYGAIKNRAKKLMFRE